MYKIISFFYWGLVAVIAFLFFPIAFAIWVLTVPFDKRRRILHLFTSFWGSFYVWINPLWKYSVTGREKIKPGQAYVLVANHQSAIDIFVLYTLFKHFKWVSKIENFKIPIIGWNMSMNRYIKLKRGDLRSNLSMMRECERNLNAGSSLMIFPEGTRSLDGNLRPFRDGAFELARKSRCSIIPILISGTGKALPAKGIMLTGRRSFQIQILDEVPYDEVIFKDTKKNCENVRTIMEKKLREIS
ncbi:MAG: 1-acyl-sn-glycerol-3-phosphate acyltransferase [Leptospira sp.]|nr:1-acyl-sn-glycerol-3-phosphate acyltransferase [Leptospira sp.]